MTHPPETAPPLEAAPHAFRQVPRTGVIYVMSEAARHGYQPDDPSWANLGQGAPETGPIPDGPARVSRVDIDEHDCEYAPVVGIPELRDAVANLYNQRYRQGMRSQYTRENVAIVAGGRTGLTRVVSTLGRAHLGHFLPDYTAYEELLDCFGAFVPIPIMLDPDHRYRFTHKDLEAEILGRGLSGLLLSNPSNPTGKVVRGDALAAWLDTGRRLDCALIFDEFYSHYAYVGDELTVSAAAHVDDVNTDPVVILDGLTKNWRYPGFRVAWVVAPRSIIEAVTSAGSFLDGGCARPMQRAALPLLDRAVADAEARAIQRMFRAKRERMIAGLEEIGVQVDLPPQGGFYCWGNLSRLPEGLRTGMELFRAALGEGVIVVPGEFFDVDPGHRRGGRPSRFRHYARFSFGPSPAVLDRGIAGLSRLVKRAT